MPVNSAPSLGNNSIVEKALKNIDSDDKEKLKKIIGEVQKKGLNGQELAKAIVLSVQTEHSDDKDFVKQVEKNLESQKSAVSKIKNLVDGGENKETKNSNQDSEKNEEIPKNLPPKLQAILDSVKDNPELHEKLKKILIKDTNSKDFDEVKKGFASVDEETINFFSKRLYIIKETQLKNKDSNLNDKDSDLNDKDSDLNDKKTKELEKENNESNSKLEKMLDSGKLSLNQINTFLQQVKGSKEKLPDRVKNMIPKFQKIQAQLGAMKGNGKSPSKGEKLQPAGLNKDTALKNNVSAGGDAPETGSETIPAGENALLNTIADNTPININGSTPSTMYSGIITKLDAGYRNGNLSATTYQSALKSIGISKIITPPKHPKPTKGDDLDNAVKEGRTRTTKQKVLQPDGSYKEETTTEKIPYTKDDPIEMDGGMTGYQKPPDKTLYVSVPAGGKNYEVKMPENYLGSVTQFVIYAQTIGLMEDHGGMATAMIGGKTGSNKFATGGTITPSIQDVELVNFIAREAIGGLTAGTQFLSKNDISRLNNTFATLTKTLSAGTVHGGDGGKQSFSPQDVRNTMKDLGIINSSGKINRKNLLIAFNYIKDNTSTPSNIDNKDLQKEMDKKRTDYEVFTGLKRKLKGSLGMGASKKEEFPKSHKPIQSEKN